MRREGNKSLLVLSDGSFFSGTGFGAETTRVGELVFNTSMTGYQEALTDASYAGQVLVLTYPLIGNYGVNKFDWESNRIQVQGFVVREFCEAYSHSKALKSISYFLEENNVPGVAGVDTRAIVKKIRNEGVVPCAIASYSRETPSVQELAGEARKLDYGLIDFVERVGTREVRVVEAGSGGKKIVLIDCGMKESILRNFLKRGINCIVVPPKTSAEEIISLNPDGVVLTNGPGDPAVLDYLIDTARKLVESIPVLGICLGHQILTHAFGGKTFKLKFGHRGANHAVRNVETGRVFITSQNHGYASEKNSLPNELQVVFENCNDGTIEGIRHKSLPCFSVQFHPEASPGPRDGNYLFDEFIKNL